MQSRRLAPALFAVAFGTNVSTPLLLLYQTELDLSAWTVTALFAVYPIGLLPALVWGGPASDGRGRRRLMVASLVGSGVASAVFIAGAESLPLLYLARLLLGAVSGVAFVVASAWMQELAGPTETERTARRTGLTLYAGFGLGPLLAGILGQWFPAPLLTPYLVHLVLVAVGLATIRRVPETVTADPTRRIRPDLGLPEATRRPFRRVVVPTALAVFGFASLSFGLFPVLLRPAMASIAVFVTGLTAAMTALSIFLTQQLSVRLGPLQAAPVALGLGTVGTALGAISFATGGWALLFPAAVALGGASGLAVTSGLSFVGVLAAPHRRGAMTGTFYGVAYAGMTAPVVMATLAGPAGFTPILVGFTALAGVTTVYLRRTILSTPELRSATASAPPPG